MTKVLLNNVDHHDLRIAARHGAAVGDSVNQTLIFPTEFEEIQRDYPILFARGSQGDYQAVALLGLGRDENLFLGASGWTARVPALIQRGPFSIGVRQRPDGSEEPMIHIDLADPRVSRDEGEPVFLPQGGNGPALDRAAAALRTIYTGMDVAAAMYPAWDALGLLQPLAIGIELSDTERVELPGYHGIAAERMASLSDAELGGLHRAGFLAPIFLVMASLANINRLIALRQAKRAWQ
jgi:SapC